MIENIPYKSFCWSLGTTSFRTKNFNKTIEEQLELLNEFWLNSDNATENWNGNSTLQEKYYNFMQDKAFVVGNANNKPKDAREKTSGLVDIGLIDSGRKLTDAGLALLKISQKSDFSTDNNLQIPKDSFIYLKQLLKSHNDVDNKCVRPFIVLLYLLSKLDYLTLDEFAYLLPLCTDKENTENILQKITDLREGSVSIDEIIIGRLMTMNNHKDGLEFLLNNAVTESVICTIGMNRKSRNFDRPYFALYNELYNVFVKKQTASTIKVFTATKKVNIGKLWRNYLFNTIAEKAIAKNPQEHINNTMFSNVKSEKDFKTVYYKVMHLLKAKDTLSDYLDLNRRYIKTTDVVLFEDSIVKMDIVPKQFFNAVIDKLYASAFETSDKLFDNCELDEIHESLVIDDKIIINGINRELGTNLSTMAEAHAVIEENRYNRLQHLIDSKFTDDKILLLLDLFEKRSDNKINSMVTDNADIPTIFEYVLGILWYKASERKGKILDYLKLSLDSDLLPKTHAAGGETDIVYEYEETEYYPQHALLLEATLADGTNQRRMEMEPVSRHLGQHLIRTDNMNSYCVFTTNFLHKNVIADFRNRKSGIYYDMYDDEKYIEGMKIIPLQTSDLKNIIKNKHTYKDLYSTFENAFNTDMKPLEWYETMISKKLI